MKPSTFLGLRTAIYFVSDLDRAKTWYAAALGIEPYYDTPVAGTVFLGRRLG